MAAVFQSHVLLKSVYLLHKEGLGRFVSLSTVYQEVLNMPPHYLMLWSKWPYETIESYTSEHT